MNQFKKSKTIITVSSIVLLSLSLLFLSSQAWFRGSGLLSPLNYIIAKVDGLFSKPTNQLSFIIDEMDNVLDVYKENKTLKASLSESRELVAENNSLIAENNSLQEALSLSETYANKETLTASVLSRNPNSWSQTLTIDVGSENDVSKDMLVMANGGLIGTLSDIGGASSTVSLLTDQVKQKNLAVKVNLPSGAVYGIITGYDKKENRYIISKLNSSSEIAKGSQVVTSDLSDQAASNILIGEVAEVKRNGDTLDMELHVSPAADFSNIYAVVLVRN